MAYNDGCMFDFSCMGGGRGVGRPDELSLPLVSIVFKSSRCVSVT